jgi:hypothetical protein
LKLSLNEAAQRRFRYGSYERTRARRSLVVVLLASLAVLALAGTAASQVVQLTTNTSANCFVFAPVSSLNGNFVAFSSNCNLGGSNSDGNREIFVSDRGAASLAQVTVSSGCSNAAPSINNSGNGVAFDSDCDLVGTNTDRNIEIFYWNGTAVSQLTTSLICSNLSPSIAGQGGVVAFDSNCDYKSTNADFSNEIFQVTTARVVTQITSDTTSSGCGSFEVSSNATGDQLAFESDCDLAGSNPDGVVEIFRAAVVGGAVTQLTADPDDAGCASRGASSSASGTLIAFESNCNLTGGNANGESEIFRVDSGGAVEQLTSASAGCENTSPAIFFDGASVLYVSDCDPLAGNADRNLEIFETGIGVGTQHTVTTGCNNFEPSPSGGDDAVAFAGDCSFDGRNGAGVDQAFFLFSGCACGAPVTSCRVRAHRREERLRARTGIPCAGSAARRRSRRAQGRIRRSRASAGTGRGSSEGSDRREPIMSDRRDRPGSERPRWRR